MHEKNKGISMKWTTILDYNTDLNFAVMIYINLILTFIDVLM